MVCKIESNAGCADISEKEGKQAPPKMVFLAAKSCNCACRIMIKDACLTPAAAEQLHAEALHLHSLGKSTQSWVTLIKCNIRMSL